MDDFLEYRKPASAAQLERRAAYGRMQKEKWAVSRDVRAGRKPIEPLYVDVWKVLPVIRGPLMDCVMLFTDQRRRAVRWSKEAGVIGVKGDGPLDVEALAALRADDTLLRQCYERGGKPPSKAAKYEERITHGFDDLPPAPAAKPAAAHDTPWRLHPTTKPVWDVESDTLRCQIHRVKNMTPEYLNVSWDGSLCVALVDGVPEDIDGVLMVQLDELLAELRQTDAGQK